MLIIICFAANPWVQLSYIMVNKFRTHIRCKKLTELQKKLMHLALTKLHGRVSDDGLSKYELLYVGAYDRESILKNIEKIELNELLK